MNRACKICGNEFTVLMTLCKNGNKIPHPKNTCSDDCKKKLRCLNTKRRNEKNKDAIVCAHCGKCVDKAVSQINRAKKKGAPLYCDKRCFGLAIRNDKTTEQKKEEKRIYDITYRNGPLRDEILKAKRAYGKTPIARASKKRYNHNMKEDHLEYCQTEKYKKWKQEYDIKRNLPLKNPPQWLIDLKIKHLKLKRMSYEKQ